MELEVSLWFCDNGHASTTKSNFCSKCGNIFDEYRVYGARCTSCNEYYAEKRKYCNKCGERLPKPEFGWAPLGE